MFLCAPVRFDHLVAIERSGRAADGNYYNMRGINIKHLVDPIDDLFTAASGIADITTTGKINRHIKIVPLQTPPKTATALTLLKLCVIFLMDLLSVAIANIYCSAHVR